MRLTKVDTDDQRWLDWCGQLPGATIFHHPAWSQVLHDAYGYSPACLALLDANEAVHATLNLVTVTSALTGNRLVSLPFTDFCPPLVRDDPLILYQLYEAVEKWRSGQGLNLYLHWRAPQWESARVFDKAYSHTTRLHPDSAVLFGRFKKTRVQQPIRQAKEAGVTTKISHTREDLQKFYHLHVATRRRLGTPVQPLRFFDCLWQRLLSQGLGFVLLAEKGHETLAAAVFLHWNQTLVYKYSASNSAYSRLRPTHLLLWHAIQWGCENGYSVLDWGKTALENEGLREFKRGWATEEELREYSVLSEFPTRPLTTHRRKQAVSFIIRHSPAWVCRLIGELLYAHSA